MFGARLIAKTGKMSLPVNAPYSQPRRPFFLMQLPSPGLHPFQSLDQITRHYRTTPQPLAARSKK
jgi:hypothetical protein